MRLRALLVLLVAVIYVRVEAKGENDDSVVQVPGRRFKIRPLKHGSQYYERMMGLRPEKRQTGLTGLRKVSYYTIAAALEKVNPPDYFSWADIPGVVTPSKYQGGCGGCYAFAAAGAVESMVAIYNGNTSMDLSEQQILDCSVSHGNEGCVGGSLVDAYRYLEANKGLRLEKDYPYRESSGQCLNPPGDMYATDLTFAQMPFGDENALKKIVFAVGPISIGVHARLGTFYKYAGGIYDDPECADRSKMITHGVLLVGYGEENGTPYWIIKNSWGTTWGVNGLMRMIRGQGMCRIGLQGSVPLPKWVADKYSAGQDVPHSFR